jgi:hypothetical protein
MRVKGAEEVLLLVEEKDWYVPYHPVGVLVWVIFRRVVASELMSARLNEGYQGLICAGMFAARNLLVTCEDFTAARESAKCSRQRIATWYTTRLEHVKQCVQHRLLASCNPTYRNQR